MTQSLLFDRPNGEKSLPILSGENSTTLGCLRFTVAWSTIRTIGIAGVRLIDKTGLTFRVSNWDCFFMIFWIWSACRRKYGMEKRNNQIWQDIDKQCFYCRHSENNRTLWACTYLLECISLNEVSSPPTHLHSVKISFWAETVVSDLLQIPLWATRLN